MSMYTPADRLIAHSLGVQLEEAPDLAGVKLFIATADTDQLLTLLFLLLRRLLAK